MNRNVKILLAFSALVAAIAYFIVASGFIAGKEREQRCKQIDVSIANAKKRSFVTESDVKSILQSNGQQLMGTRVSKISCYKLEELLRSKSYIKSAEVYVDINGTLNVNVEQRKPILRVNTAGGGFYLDEDGFVFPLSSSYTEYVPIVTGTPPLPFAVGYKGYIPQNASAKLLRDLLNFALFLRSNSYWNSMIVQINVVNENRIELIPRVGSHVVILGSLDSYEYKLHKLHVFYEKGMKSIGWNTYKTINLSYGKQVVCKK